jgi:hypothetical protein
MMRDTEIHKEETQVRATLEEVMRKLEEALRLSKRKEEEACRRG